MQNAQGVRIPSSVQIKTRVQTSAVYMLLCSLHAQTGSHTTRPISASFFTGQFHPTASILPAYTDGVQFSLSAYEPGQDGTLGLPQALAASGLGQTLVHASHAQGAEMHSRQPPRAISALPSSGGASGGRTKGGTWGPASTGIGKGRGGGCWVAQTCA